MTLSEYFNQTRYFSESSQEFVDIDKMAFPHAVYSHRKLLTEHHNEYLGTPLCNAFVEYLYPDRARLSELLDSYGVASCIYTSRADALRVRSRFYKAAAALGVKVSTHKDEKLGIIRGEIPMPKLSVTVKGRTFAE